MVTKGFNVLVLVGAIAFASVSFSVDFQVFGLRQANDDGLSNPPGWDTEVALPRATDVNPDPAIVEVHLEAVESVVELASGLMTPVFAYKDLPSGVVSVPGPMIEAKLGDTLIVQLTNSLPVGTSVHWHGVELPADMDGSNLAQRHVPPGSTFTYEYEVLNPAFHWYHPHFETNEQIELGLHGPLLFRDPAEDEELDLPMDSDGLTTELTLVLDDAAIDRDTGKFLKFAQENPGSSDLPTDPTPLTPVERTKHLMDGRELDNNVLLVNGRELPTVVLRTGVPQRWRIVNVANGRFMRLSLPAEWQPYRIGGDGGLLREALPVMPIELVTNPDAGEPGQPDVMPNPETVILAEGDDGENGDDDDGVENGTVIAEIGILLSPGERADVVFTPQGAADDEVILDWYDYPRGRHAPTIIDEFGNIAILDDELDGKRPLRRQLRILLAGSGAGDDDNEGWEPSSPLPRSLPIDDIRSDSSDGPLSLAFGHTPPAPATFLPELLRGRVMFFVSMTQKDDLITRAKEAIADLEIFGETDIDKVGPTAVKFPVATADGIVVNTVMVGGGGGRPTPFATVPPFLAAPGMVIAMEQDGVGEAVGLNSDEMGLIVDRAALKANIGETRIWEIVNLTGGEHPFHPHGFFFQPIEAVSVDLAANGGKGQIVERTLYALENKDSLRLPGRPGGQFTSFSLLRAVVRLDDSAREEAGRPDLVRRDEDMLAEGVLPGGDGTVGPNPGDSGAWVLHCHILEHADLGMFNFFELGPRLDDSDKDGDDD